jgi:hypothetical protein
MSTETPPPPVSPPAVAPPAPPTYDQQEIKIVSHSNLFYWWPVWAAGFILGILSLFEGKVVAVVPKDVEVSRRWKVETAPDVYETREGYILPKDRHLASEDSSDPNGKPAQPHLRMTTSSTYGVIWATILLLVIVITNVPMRGLWSWVIIVVGGLLVIIFALAGWWDTIFYYLSVLDIRINAGGYFFISSILCAIWLISVMIFDRQIYMTFTPGQLRLCLDIGGGETAYDTTGMVIQKQRNDLFRHVILGLGSGDLIVRTSGANAHEFHLPNVLFVGRKLQIVEAMQRDRPVVKGSA